MSFDDFLIKAAFVAVVIIGFLIYSERSKRNIAASIPEEFKYVHVSLELRLGMTNGSIAIDPRNKKMLLSLKDGKKIYDFSDIQGYERDSHISKGKRTRTWYDLILHVNDQVNPTWQFSSYSIEDIDSMELLVNRALDGTLPATDERRVIHDYASAEEVKSFLSTGTGAQG